MQRSALAKLNLAPAQAAKLRAAESPTPFRAFCAAILWKPLGRPPYPWYYLGPIARADTLGLELINSSAGTIRF
jgi:hypothetical protein